MIQHTKVEVFRRQIPTVFGIRIKRVSNAARDDEVTIVAGIGKNSAGYEDPYDISQSGRKYFDNYEFIIKYVLGSHRACLSPFFRMFYTEKVAISSSISFSISKLDPELRGLLYVASMQLERRGAATIRMLVQHIQYRKSYLICIL